jgi:toxin ParE1/3/4
MKLRYTPRAHADIGYIYGYIAEHNRSAAAAVVREIRLTSELLAEYPGIGRDTDIPGVRVFPVARFPYLIYHRTREDELAIIHVRHGRRETLREEDL